MTVAFLKSILSRLDVKDDAEVRIYTYNGDFPVVHIGIYDKQFVISTEEEDYTDDRDN